MPFNPPHYRGGDLIRAADVNAQNDEIRRLDRRRSGPGVIVRTGQIGEELQLDLPEEIFIRLTSTANSSGAYAWAEVVMTSPGTWTLTGRTGDQAEDPAFERRTGDTTLSAGPTVFRALRAPVTDAWVFAHRGTTPPPSCAQICVKVIGCAGFPVPNAQVTISKSGFSQTVSVVTSVSGFTMKALGSGYLATPTIAISSGGGTGASAIPIVSGGVVTSTFLTSGGSNYTTAPSVLISGGGGTGATAIVRYAPTTVASIALSNGGSGYTGIPGITFTTPTGQTGSGATAAATMGVSAIASIASGGTGYLVGDFLTLLGGTATTNAVLRVSTTFGGVITGVTIPTQGSYTVLPASPTPVTGGTGHGATFDLFWHVLSVAVTGSGSNYSTPPNVGFSGGGGSGAVATARLVATRVASVVVTAGGSGYNNNPGVTISDVSGSGAVAIATVSGGQVTLTVANGGSGYTCQTTVAISPPPTGTTATATPLMTSQGCINIPSTGLYTAAVSAPRFNNGSTTVTASTCIGSPVLSATVTLTPASGYACCGFCWKPIATTLFVTGGPGAAALVWNGSNSWVSSTLTANGPVYSGTGTTLCSSSASGSTDVTFALDCRPGTSNVFRFNERWNCYNCLFDVPPLDGVGYYVPSGQFPSGATIVTSIIDKIITGCCADPFTLTFSPSEDVRFNQSPCGSPTGLLAPYQGPFTITE